MSIFKKDEIKPSSLYFQTILWGAGLFVAFISLEVFMPCLENGFVNWDDGLYIYHNKVVQSADILLLDGYIKLILTERIAYNWHPLTIISHILDYNIWGLIPFGHHLTSILIHSLNTLLFFFLCITLFTIYSTNNPLNFNVLAAAFFSAIIFGIHPLRVESVAWISERKDVLFTCFYLLSLLAYIKYTSITGFARYCYYGVSFIFFCFSSMSKPMAISLPFVLLVLDFFPLERFTMQGKGKRTAVKRILIEKLPFFIGSILLALVTIWAQVSGSPKDYLIYNRIFVPAYAYIFYLYKIIWPDNLLPFYPMPSKINFLKPEYWGSLLLFIGINLFVYKNFNKRKLLSSVWIYYVVTLLPVVGIIHVGKQIAADRYTYLPSLGLSIVAGIGLATVLKKNPLKSKISVLLFFTLLVGCLVDKTNKQITIWRDPIALWTHQIENQTGSNVLGYINRSSAQVNSDFDMNRYDLALKDINRAIMMKSDEKEAFYTRGIIYNSRGHYKKAIDDFDKVFEIESGNSRNIFNVKSYLNRGISHFELGDLQEAKKDFGRAIAVEPRYSEAYFNRGKINNLLGNFDDAISDYKMTVHYEKTHAEAYYNLSRIYQRMGDKTNAFNYLMKTARLDVSLLEKKSVKIGKKMFRQREIDLF